LLFSTSGKNLVLKCTYACSLVTPVVAVKTPAPAAVTGTSSSSLVNLLLLLVV